MKGGDTHGLCQKTERRVRRSSYSPIQKKGDFIWDPLGFKGTGAV